MSDDELLRLLACEKRVQRRDLGDADFKNFHVLFFTREARLHAELLNAEFFEFLGRVAAIEAYDVHVEIEALRRFFELREKYLTKVNTTQKGEI